MSPFEPDVWERKEDGTPSRRRPFVWEAEGGELGNLGAGRHRDQPGGILAALDAMPATPSYDPRDHAVAALGIFRRRHPDAELGHVGEGACTAGDARNERWIIELDGFGEAGPGGDFLGVPIWRNE